MFFTVKFTISTHEELMDLAYIEKPFLKKYSGINNLVELKVVYDIFINLKNKHFIREFPEIFIFFFKKENSELNNIGLLPSEPLICLMSI